MPICYRDMTFCTFYQDCANASKCHRPLTPEVQEAARQWWGDIPGGPPIAQFMSKPGCHSDNHPAEG